MNAALRPGLLVVFCAFTAASVAAAESGRRAPQDVVFGSSAGDNPGEEQPPPAGYAIPPAPALSPAETLKSFRLPPGYRIETVASEPLVNTPVAIDFDPDGRIWVVEMRGYQNNPEGSDRLNPIGRIVVLEDTDHDGKMDRSTVYMDGLVLPRAIRVLSDGVLVAEPPYVWHTRDTNGDLRMDEKSVVVDDYGVRDSNPGHAANGLLWGMDNWIHSSTYSGRLRRIDGRWVKEAVPVLGHFGMGMDDFGRTYMNPNSPPLRANFLSTHYVMRNPNHDGGGGVYETITGASEREVFPIRPNPGANRGYMKGTLRKDGRLAKYTAGCGISIFRGDRLPAEMKGNHFFCEPAANLVRRTVLTEHEDGTISGVNPYRQAEFLASTDERFRPVNTCTGPDGALYVVDMYRGVLESHPFVTTYLKRQIYERGLDRPLDRGRIYRIVHESMAPGPAPRLSKATATELVAALTHPNGWWRDTAQRLLVERKELSAVAALKQLALSEAPEVSRLHAWWTLEGIGALTGDDLVRAFGDASKRIRAVALRLSEPWLRRGEDARLLKLATEAANDPAAAVRLQAAASLGEVKGPAGTVAMATLVARHASQPYLVDAVVYSLADRELDFLRSVGPSREWQREQADFRHAVTALSAAIFRSGKATRIQELLTWTAQGELPAWQKLAVLQSVTKPTRVSRSITFPAELKTAPDERMRKAALALEQRLQTDDAASARALTKVEEDLLRSGAKLYGVYCAQCHQENGRGLPGLAPALVDSKWVLGSPVTAAKIVLSGKQDKGLVMPPWGNVLDNQHVAAILTYVRRTWGNVATPVLPETIQQARGESAGVHTLWTEESLLEHAAKADKG